MANPSGALPTGASFGDSQRIMSSMQHNRNPIVLDEEELRAPRELQESLKLCKVGLRTAEEVYGNKSLQVADGLSQVGQVYYEMESFSKALDYWYKSATIYSFMGNLSGAETCAQKIRQICAQSTDNSVIFNQKYLATYEGESRKIRFFRLSDDPSTIKAHIFTNNTGTVGQLVGVISGDDIEIEAENTTSKSIASIFSRWLFPNSKLSQLNANAQKAVLNSLCSHNRKIEVITGRESREIKQLKIFDPS